MRHALQQRGKLSKQCVVTIKSHKLLQFVDIVFDVTVVVVRDILRAVEEDNEKCKDGGKR